MKKLKKMISISSVDETAGRVLVNATGLENNTGIAVLLNGQPWGVGTIDNEQALIVGQTALPDTYSLSVSVQTVNTKLQPSE